MDESVLAFKANNRWISDNQKQLKQQFGDQWVAVFNKVVVDKDSDLKNLVRRLKEANPSVYSEIAVEFMVSDEPEMVPPIFSRPQP